MPGVQAVESPHHDGREARRLNQAQRRSTGRALQVGQRELLSAAPELLAFGQRQVRPGFFSGESVRKTHRAPAEVADAVSAEDVQTLEAERRGRAVTTLHLPQTTECGTGRERSVARETRVFLRTDGERARPAEMAYRLTHEQLAGQDRDDRTRRREQRTRRWRPAGQAEARNKNGNPHFAHSSSMALPPECAVRWHT